ncbi:unnamed protein product [Cylicocyclus nassatus]|uniref:Uncharacterized protein n=1 Tax=Cylicocyclus nassatus TaxID=53992 RepID=A0AA36MEK0_CYLNA|nr:unnamed protein product [Cylicocyclus nassatus]
MPPKRAKNKSRAHREAEKVENDTDDVKGVALDHKILLNPAFKLDEIVERGSVATMKSWSAVVTEHLNWLQSQKAALKELMRSAYDFLAAIFGFIHY